MAVDVTRVEYYNKVIKDHDDNGSELLATLSGAGIGFLAYKSVPRDAISTQFTLFPQNCAAMVAAAAEAGLDLDGPHPALLVKDDDESGALAEIFAKLSHTGITIQESTGIADINGGYGVVLYLEPDDCDRAMIALER